MKKLVVLAVAVGGAFAVWKLFGSKDSESDVKAIMLKKVKNAAASEGDDPSIVSISGLKNVGGSKWIALFLVNNVASGVILYDGTNVYYAEEDGDSFEDAMSNAKKL